MPTLRDPFDRTEQKNGFTYISWSQAADRLDEAQPDWSFAIMAIGPDWVHGRLTFADGRFFENIGYAENADAQWKKEPLKDAVSDALKRCAALAGVARYLYDGTTHGAVASSSAPTVQRSGGSAPRPAAPTVPPEPEGLMDEAAYEAFRGEDTRYAPSATEMARHGNRSPDPAWMDEFSTCPDHGLAWVLKPAGVSKSTGKEYTAFWACPSTERPFCKEKPAQQWVDGMKAGRAA